MNYVMTAIHDSKTGFLTPACHQTQEAAIRDFIALCRNSEAAVSQFPEDFTLVRLGVYDSETGVIIPETVDTLCSATVYVRGRDAE